MTASDPRREFCLLGVLDWRGRQVDRLAAWAEGQSAHRIVERGPFRLWLVPAVATRPTLVHGADYTGAVIGDIFCQKALNEPGIATALGTGYENAVVDAFRREGAKALDRVVGQFSLIVWDHQSQQLLVYADDTSSHKIYWCQPSSDTLFFSTSLDVIASSPFVEKRLSQSSLHEYLRFLDISPPNTIYHQLFAMEAATVAKVSRAQRTFQPEPVVPAETARPQMDPGTALADLDRWLVKAVEDRIDKSGRTVAFLSGGIDSSLLAAIAAERARSSVTALTMGFDDRDFDESYIAHRIAKHIGIPHQVVRLPLEAYAECFGEFYAGVEFPFADPASVATGIAFRAAREVAEVALDGTGADTLLGIMPARHYRVAINYADRLPVALRRRIVAAVKSIPALRRYTPVFDFEDVEELLVRWRGWSRREIEMLYEEPVSLSHTRFYKIFRTYPRSSHLERYSALMASLPDDRIHESARLTGLKVRFPYFDMAVTSCVNALDDSLKYRDNVSKVALRALLEKRVPKALWDLPKHGFDFPFIRFMARDNFALVHDYLAPSQVNAWGLFDHARVRPAIAGLLAGDRRFGFRVWGLLVLFAWLEHHWRKI